MTARYSCKNTRRGGTTTSEVQAGWTDDGRRIMQVIQSEWLPVRCGYSNRAQDKLCEGCSNRNG